jgi:hypothetical protein
MDFGTWVWIHRAGVCVTLLFVLAFGVAFVSWQFRFGDKRVADVVYVEFETPPEEMVRPVAAAEMPVDYGSVSNRSSNENAELDAGLRDSRGRGAGDLYNDAAGLSDRMRANREAYEAGLRQNQEMIDAARRPAESGEERPRSTRSQGNVTASYSFTDPVRNHEFLDIPAYRCEGGGQVTVVATLDVNGYVVAAEVDRGASTSDGCLQREALASARASRFNLDTRAPARQKGTITYLFVPQ